MRLLRLDLEVDGLPVVVVMVAEGVIGVCFSMRLLRLDLEVDGLLVVVVAVVVE